MLRTYGFQATTEVDGNDEPRLRPAVALIAAEQLLAVLYTLNDAGMYYADSWNKPWRDTKAALLAVLAAAYPELNEEDILSDCFESGEGIGYVIEHMLREQRMAWAS